MQSRPHLCSVHLKEVEGKLIPLRNAIGDDVEAKPGSRLVLQSRSLLSSSHGNRGARTH